MLADAQARNKMEDEAATNLMRITVLHPEQHGLAATALYRCANLRQNAGHTDESRTLWAEILRNYSNTIWAKQASAHLNESNSKN
jgi:TolA-binding protein